MLQSGHLVQERIVSEEPGETMTIAEIRRYTGASRTTIYRWIKAKKLQPVEVSSAWLDKPQPRFRKSDVDALRKLPQEN
jgi:excisionase family DNA binding protein